MRTENNTASHEQNSRGPGKKTPGASARGKTGGQGRTCKKTTRGQGPARKISKKFGPFLDLCVSSLRRGHANLLCIVPILSDVSEETKQGATLRFISWCFRRWVAKVVLSFVPHRASGEETPDPARKPRRAPGGPPSTRLVASFSGPHARVSWTTRGPSYDRR